MTADYSFSSRPSLSILDLCDVGNEGLALRFAAEEFGYLTQYYPIGAPSHIGEALERSKGSAVTLLCCHGDEDGLVMPELADELYESEPFRGALSPTKLTNHIDLAGQTVFCTGCLGGSKEFGAAALKAGVEFWIGFEDYPEGSEVFLSVIFFLAQLAKSRDRKAAFAETKTALVDIRRKLRMYNQAS